VTHRFIAGLMLASALGSSLVADSSSRLAQVRPSIDGASATSVVVIQDFARGLAGVCTANAAVHLNVDRDPAISDARVLFVDYPAPANDPAARDVRCATENSDWTRGLAMSFQVKPDHAMRMSFSFADRNHVAYTAWRDLKGGEWQTVRIPFSEIRPNPFFQFPDASTGAPLDVSDVKAIAFAPQDKTTGRLAIGPIVVSK
jgi:Carbohydrate binding domain (family 11)